MKSERIYARLKNVILMTPGKHNGFEYSKEEIEKAFKKTDWEKAKHIFIDYKDFGLSSWVGYIQNPRIKGGIMYGDCKIVLGNKFALMQEAKVPVGFSPKIRGEIKTKLKDFTFENFSLVMYFGKYANICHLGNTKWEE